MVECSYRDCTRSDLLHGQIYDGDLTWRCPTHRMAENLAPPF